uniref:Variant surface glycoprotein 1323 n=1 Tax=Trypanosoma brucei TaxID=5691 RepID=M4SY96_9TRYP|nr:variant surface glycoprotein 1323 [Trypanosoma brucei]
MALNMWLNHCGLIVAALLPLAETAANDNAAAHRVYCNLLTVASIPYTTSGLNDDPNNAFSTMLAMNFSTSSNDWTAMFDTSKEAVTPKNPPEEKTPGTDKETWQTMWPQWWAAGRRCVTEKIGQGDKPAYPPISKPEQKKQAHRELKKLIDGTKHLVAECQTVKNDIKTKKTQLDSYLSEALLGEQNANGLPTPTKGIAAITNWGSACGPNLRGKSIAADFLCACNNNQDTSKQCDPNYDPQNWATGINVAEKWPLLKNSCKEPLAAELTAGQIHGALATFSAALQHADSGGTKYTFLGISSDHQCTGAAAKLCVDYTAYFDKTTGHTATKIPWKEKLEKAATTITVLEAKALEGRNLARQIQANFHVCQGIYAAAATGTLVDSVNNAISPLKPSTTDIQKPLAITKRQTQLALPLAYGMSLKAMRTKNAH